MSGQLLYIFGDPMIRLRAFVCDTAQWLRDAPWRGLLKTNPGRQARSGGEWSRTGRIISVFQPHL